MRNAPELSALFLFASEHKLKHFRTNRRKEQSSDSAERIEMLRILRTKKPGWLSPSRLKSREKRQGLELRAQPDAPFSGTAIFKPSGDAKSDTCGRIGEGNPVMPVQDILAKEFQRVIL